MQESGVNKQTIKSNRNSSIELLRIISMWMIVFYHFHTHVLQAGSDAVVFRAAQIPIHIAVVCFILISGYFGIHASIKGFSKLLAKIMFYALSITLLVVLYGYISGNQVYYSTDYINQHPFSKGFALNSLLFVTRSPLWFIRSYLLLYLVSPFLNKVLDNQNKQERILLLIVLGVITLWVDLLRTDGMGGGKNVLNFCFLYAIGRTIKEYDLLQKVTFKVNLTAYIILTASVVGLYAIFDGTALGTVIGVLAFRYNGVICVLTAVLFFLLFARLHFHSGFINSISASVFAIYLIHEHPLLNRYIYQIVDFCQQNMGIAKLYVCLLLYSIVIMFIAVLIDKVTMPVQIGLANLFTRSLNCLGVKIGLKEK